MARKRITDNPIVVSTGAAAAAPVRRKPSTSTRTRATRTADSPASEPQNVVTPAEPVAEIVITTAPTYEEIATLAYSYWAGRGHQGGSPEEDWLRAERELSAK